MRVIDVANTFINIGANAPSPITNMKLQKLLYYAQGWYLALTNNPLFDSDFERWTYGPVCPEIYQEFRHYGSAPITQISDKGMIISEGECYSFINAIWDRYGHLDGVELSLQTHREEPWITTPRFEVIKKDLIKNYFKSQIKTVLEA